MDALSEVLQVIRIDSAIFLNGEFSEPWCFSSPESHRLAPMLNCASAHVIIYHLLCEGRAYFEVHGGNRVLLSPGDLVALPHGHAYRMGGGPRMTPVRTDRALPGMLAHGLELLNVGGGGEPCRFICGYLACDAQLSQAFLGGLPPLIRLNLRDDEPGRWLETSLRFSVAQAASQDAGASGMLAKLSEVFFAETLRRYQRGLAPEQTGWLAGARDPGVGKALTLMHRQPAHPWTLADLARESGLSRTVLAERFRYFLGDPPMAYLTRWRLRLGARALLSTPRSIAEIAAEVGYESEAAFNRAFKREHGLPPARYRREKATRVAESAAPAGSE